MDLSLSIVVVLVVVMRDGWTVMRDGWIDDMIRSRVVS